MGADERYPHLFSPFSFRGLELRNRIVQGAHAKMLSEYGRTTQREIDYLEARARGGAGLLVGGFRPVHPSSAMPRTTLGYLRDAVAEDWRLTAAVHEHGAAILAQLSHIGAFFASDLGGGGLPLWAPSANRSPTSGEIAHGVDEEEIGEIVGGFGLSAELAREAGFDGVELQFAHGFLVHQFLDPLYNRRTDGYGGTAEGRLRLALEVLAEVRRRGGDDQVVGVRLPLGDFSEEPGALVLQDAIAIAAAIRDTGLVDYLGMTVGGLSIELEISPSDVSGGHLVEDTAAVRRAVPGLPVLAVGGLQEPGEAEALLAADKADLVVLTRALIADPDYPEKVRMGREDEVVRCIRVNQGCIGRVARLLPLRCTVNPAAGHERELGGAPARVAESGRWVVVGGGPAGMKAAATLARRGHRVVLLEREEKLGGQLELILRTPGRKIFRRLVEDLVHAVRTAGVEVRLQAEASAEYIQEFEPDGVVVATGAVPGRGGFEHVLTPREVLLDPRRTGVRVLVLDDDGGRCAAGVVEVLLDLGRQVELAATHPTLLPGTTFTADRALLCRRLLGKGLRVRLGCHAQVVERGAVVLRDLTTGEETRVEAETVVLVGPRVASDDLYRHLLGSVRVCRVGDCLAPRQLDDAIREGFLAGLERLGPPSVAA